MRQSPKNLLLFIGCLALSMAARAHGGDTEVVHREISFLDGLLHPLTGMDHLAAMLAVGFWSATSSQRIWIAPMAFANMLLAGAILGLSGYTLPAVEPLIASSLLVLGLLVAGRARLSEVSGLVIAGGFAVFHGMAHGQEMAAGTHWLAQLLGMLATTVALHLTGIVTGWSLRERSAWWSRAAGAAVAVLGSVLLVQMA